MRVNNKDPIQDNYLISLKDKIWLDRQRRAGKVAAGALSMLQSLVKEKTTLSCLELNNLAEEYIIKNGGTPTFKGYKGFPAGVCISLNKELVHGIPKNIFLQEGDIVSFDLGVTIEGAIADSAITCIYGDARSELESKLIKVTEEALLKAIESIKVGNRLGCIGNAIHKHIKKNGFSTIEKYAGHGISYNCPHDSPFVANKAEVNEGIVIQPGLSIAIEPLAIMGDTYTYVSNDGWTVLGYYLSSHHEHSIFVHEDHVEILTLR